MTCPCGCGRPSTGKSKYHHPPTCRPRAHKVREQLKGLTPVERKRLKDKLAKRAARARGRVPSDDRVSFSRAVEVVADYLCQSWPEAGANPRLAEAEAREILERARPKR